MNMAVPLLMLQVYINPCLHLLVNSAIITLIMQQNRSAGQITKCKHAFYVFIFLFRTEVSYLPVFVISLVLCQWLEFLKKFLINVNQCKLFKFTLM